MSSTQFPAVGGAGRRVSAGSTDSTPHAQITFNRSGMSDAQRRRERTVGVWSAVALQQHFGLSGGAGPLTAVVRSQKNRRAPRRFADFEDDDGGDGDGSRPPPLAPLPAPSTVAAASPGRQRWTLAQKMRLVPPPPSAPTPSDWHAAETRALLRAQHQFEDAREANALMHADALAQRRQLGLGGRGENMYLTPATAQVCSICYDPFYLSSSQDQVILSCSHVFHARCFQQFERLVRRQQREELAATEDGLGTGIGVLTTRLACPECRSTGYFKRRFFAGKAQAQRAAIIRIQAAIRGFLSRRQYLQLRLKTNTAFRGAFVEERLSRLSRAWETYLLQEERARELCMAALEVQRQTAAAAFLTEADWQQLIQKRLAAAQIAEGEDDVDSDDGDDHAGTSGDAGERRGDHSGRGEGTTTGSVKSATGGSILLRTRATTQSTATVDSGRSRADGAVAAQGRKNTTGRGCRCVCAICLEAVVPNLRPSQALAGVARRSNADRASTHSPLVVEDICQGRDSEPVRVAGGSVYVAPGEAAEEDGTDARTKAMLEDMRRNYEARRREAEEQAAAAASGGKKRRTKTAPRGGRATPTTLRAKSATGGKLPSSAATPPIAEDRGHDPSRPSTRSPEAGSEVGQGAGAQPPHDSHGNNPPHGRYAAEAVAAPRYGVIVSCCSHVFHDACLGTFERFTERQALAAPAPAAAAAASREGPSSPVAVVLKRCPLCRSGYGKHAF